MLDGISLSWLGPGSGWAVAGTFVLFMAFGKLIPRSWAEERIKDLKDAHALSEEARRLQAQQIDEILTVVRATANAVTADKTRREPV